MEKEIRAHHPHFVVVTLNKPTLWTRTPSETWLLNPRRRYILNADTLSHIAPYIESVSEFSLCRKYRPLSGNANLVKRSVLIERYRERGIGDLLFMTGPLAYLQYVSSSDAHIDFYAMAGRGAVLIGNPHIANKTPLYGPVTVEDLELYDHHWFSETATEYDEEPDQLNVYDALYRQIGVDPDGVDPRFKRPVAALTDEDHRNLDALLFWVFQDSQVDLRRSGYYVVAPLANSSLRSMNYSTWLNIIAKLSARRPVIVVGEIKEGYMPTMDMAFGEFFKQVANMGAGVVNMMGETPLRHVMAIINRAVALVCLDSGTLYIAQAFRTPAVSIWGTHAPKVRLGYDADYMETAVWNQRACPASPCFAYRGFPASKCPQGEQQSACDVLRSVSVDDVTARIDLIESKHRLK